MGASPNQSIWELISRPGVRNLLISNACGVASSVTLAISMGVHVYALTGREFDIALVGLAEFLPTFLLVLPAGTLADRVDRRSLAAVGYLLEASVAIAGAGYLIAGGTGIWPLLLLTAVYGTARGFVNPAARALPANVVSREDLPRLIPAQSTVWQLAIVITPILIGALYGAGPRYTFMAIAFLNLVAARAVKRVRFHSPQERIVQKPGFRTALEGFRLVRETPLLLAAIGLDLFAVLLGGVIALGPAICVDLVDAPASAAFWIRSACGIGAALTALFLTKKPLNNRIGPRLLLAIAIFGILHIGIAFSSSLLLTLLLFAGAAAADMVSVFIRTTIVPLATPDSVRGRVLAVEAVFIGASNELGAFESGITAQWFGLRPAIIFAGISTLVVVALFAVFVPDLRKLDRFEDIGA
jgi:MFS family permease